MSHEKPCPHCGYCPTCGRSRGYYPYYPNTYPYGGPYWYSNSGMSTINTNIKYTSPTTNQVKCNHGS